MLDKLRKCIIGKSTISDRSNFIWNMIGSGIYSIASMVLTYLTIRIIGDRDGGVFAIALTISQMLIYFAYFEMRTFQVTDSKDEYTFQDYYTTKIITCFMMVVISIFYVLLKGYNFQKSLIVFMVCIYRLEDGFADVFESQFHKDGRLDIAGKSIAFRTVLSVSVYFVLLVLTKNLLYALVAAIIMAVLGVWLFDILVYKDFGKIELTNCPGVILKVLRSCFPLFLGTFLWTYILSASRLAIDEYMSSEYQSYYQVLFMPVSVINLFAGFVFRPMLLTLTGYYAKRKYRNFLGVIGKNISIMVVFTTFCMLCAYTVGPEVLSFLVNCDLKEYRELLTFLVFSGGLNAIAIILYYILTIIRSNKGIITGYVIAAVLAYNISPLMVKKSGMMGAGLSYFIVILVLNVIFISVITANLIKHGKLKGKEN